MYRYYRIVEIAAKKTQEHFLIKKDSNDIYSFEPKKKVLKNDIYKGILPRCLDTDEMESFCDKKSNRSLLDSYQFRFSYFEKPSLSKKESKSQSFQGYSDYLIKVVFKKNDVEKFRENFYENGFYYEGRHYIRYKRSAGNAKENCCLFILKEIYEQHMNAWNLHYLKKSEITDITSFEAYSALTLSSIQYFFDLPREAFLIMEDVESVSKDMAITMASLEQSLNTNSKNIRESFTTEVEVKNTLWDGEALVDESVFKAHTFIHDKHMILLRNHYFKTCGFRTRLQQWFNDNNISSVDQLNGFTLAKSISDIKVVFTRSSLKYLKVNSFDSLESGFRKWIGNQKKLKFGIVKTDKAPSHMDGHMVKTNYQLLNTIGLNKSECKELLRPSLLYLERIKQSPQFLRHYINSELSFNEENSNELGLNYQYDVFTNLIIRTSDFSGTQIYDKFLNNLAYNYRKKLLRGEILVNGTNATIFGNPVEFLYATITKGYKAGDPIKDTMGNTVIALKNNEIFCSRFECEEVCCSRSPHITMGNILLGKNTNMPLVEYFELSDNIVCINAINNNIQQQLNGADYDSDFMLITNNNVLVSAVKRQGVFPVPFNDLKPKPFISKYEKPHEILAEIDSILSHDMTGKIVNLSQIFNSLWWTKINRISDVESFWHDDCDNGNEDTDQIYSLICRLAILSNIAIDRAKRHYPFDISQEIDNLRKDELIYGASSTKIQNNICEISIDDYPSFFNEIFNNEPKRIKKDVEQLLSDSVLIPKLTHKNATSACTMALIYDIINEDCKKTFGKTIAQEVKSEFDLDERIERRKHQTLLCDLIESSKEKSNNDGTQRDQIKKLVFETYQQIKMSSKDSYINKLDALYSCEEQVEKILNGKYYHNKIYLLLKDIDNDIKDFHRRSLSEEQRIKIKEEQRYYALLFALICFAQNKEGEYLLYPLIEEKAKSQNTVPKYRIVSKKDISHPSVLNGDYELEQL